MDILKMAASFTWGWGDEFFLELGQGKNYIWSDPEYGGDNTIRPTNKSYRQWIDPHGQGIFGRDKGVHIIEDYCGKKAKLIK